MKKLLQIFSLLFLTTTFFSFNQSQIKLFAFAYCESDSGACMKKCNVVLTSGTNISMGSYIKVYIGKELITEGYILKHVSGEIYILKNKSDAKNPEICGGCCGEAYSINISKKQIWGC